jgi:hypothetical protein
LIDSLGLRESTVRAVEFFEPLTVAKEENSVENVLQPTSTAAGIEFVNIGGERWRRNEAGRRTEK